MTPVLWNVNGMCVWRVVEEDLWELALVQRVYSKDVLVNATEHKGDVLVSKQQPADARAQCKSPNKRTRSYELTLIHIRIHIFIFHLFAPPCTITIIPMVRTRVVVALMSGDERFRGCVCHIVQVEGFMRSHVDVLRLFRAASSEACGGLVWDVVG